MLQMRPSLLLRSWRGGNRQPMARGSQPPKLGLPGSDPYPSNGRVAREELGDHGPRRVFDGRMAGNAVLRAKHNSGGPRRESCTDVLHTSLALSLSHGVVGGVRPRAGALRVIIVAASGYCLRVIFAANFRIEARGCHCCQ